jgi:hypothetical protein
MKAHQSAKEKNHSSDSEGDEHGNCCSPLAIRRDQLAGRAIQGFANCVK